MQLDTLIVNGILVTVNPDFEIIENGWVGIKDGQMVRVQPHRPGLLLPSALETVDAKGGIVMPGLVNTHTHLPMTLFRGLADDLPLMTWLNDHIFPAEATFIQPESVYTGRFWPAPNCCCPEPQPAATDIFTNIFPHRLFHCPD